MSRKATTMLVNSITICAGKRWTLKGIRGWYGSHASSILKGKKGAPSMSGREGMNLHLGRAFEVTRQRKTLPKKTDNAEVVGKPSHDDSEGITRWIRQKIRLGDSKTAPSPTLNTRQTRRRNQKQLQVQSSASRAQIWTSTHGTGTNRRHNQKT